MIVPMKRLTLVVHQSHKNTMLSRLQELGVCHIQEREGINQENLITIKDRIQKLQESQTLLEETSERSSITMPQKNWRVDIEEVLQIIDETKARRDQALRELYQARQQEALLAPYGNFDPEVLEAIEKARVKIAFCSMAMPPFTKIEEHGLHLFVLSETKSAVYFVVFYKKNQKMTPMEKRILATQVELPRVSLNKLRQSITDLQEELQDIERSLIEHTKYHRVIAQSIAMDQDRLGLEQAKETMEPLFEGRVSVLRGWIPKEAVETTEEALGDLCAVWFMDEPSHHDTVPVKLKQDPFTRLFQPLLKLFSLPNYHETDTTPYFAPFYAIFFGLCLADLGYGMLLFIGLIIALIAVKSKEARPLILLGLVLSSSVMIAGIVLDDFFGERLVTEYEHELVIEGGIASIGPAEKGEGIYSFGKLLEPFGWFKEQDDAMLLPMMLGVIQVILGWMVRVKNSIRHAGWQGFGQPTGNIFFLLGLLLWAFPSFPTLMGPEFSIGPLPIGLWMTAPGANVGLGLLAVGLALIILFNGAEQGRKLWIRPLAGLWSLYELSTGIISDILSYLRLFALGLAGGLLAEAVNGIAWGILEGARGALPYFGFILIMVIGHGLNMGLGLLSAFVHSLRLQFVEFYKAVEFKGGGLAYNPLRSSQK